MKLHLRKERTEMKISRWLKITQVSFNCCMYCDGQLYSEQRDADKEIKYVYIQDNGESKGE